MATIQSTLPLPPDKPPPSQVQLSLIIDAQEQARVRAPFWSQQKKSAIYDHCWLPAESVLEYDTIGAASDQWFHHVKMTMKQTKADENGGSGSGDENNEYITTADQSQQTVSFKYHLSQRAQKQVTDRIEEQKKKDAKGAKLREAKKRKRGTRAEQAARKVAKEQEQRDKQQQQTPKPPPAKKMKVQQPSGSSAAAAASGDQDYDDEVYEEQQMITVTKTIRLHLTPKKSKFQRDLMKQKVQGVSGKLKRKQTRKQRREDRKAGKQPKEPKKSISVKQKLRQWMGCARHTYNWALKLMDEKMQRWDELVKEQQDRDLRRWQEEQPDSMDESDDSGNSSSDEDKNQQESISNRPPDDDILKELQELKTRMYSKTELQKLVVNVEAVEAAGKDWLLSTPAKVRQGAVDDLLQAYKSNFAMWQKNKKHRFKMKFRSKKDPLQSIRIDTQGIKNMVIYPEYLSKEPIRTSKKQKKLARQLTSPLKKDARLVVDRVGRWFLHIPVQQPVETQDRFPLEREGLAAIDPGVCAFLSYYSPDRQVAGQIGVQYDRDMLFRLCELLDDLVSRMYKAKGKPLGPDSENIGSRRRHKMKKAEHRLRIRIRNKVKDIHHKAAHFLTTHFRYILLPKFDVSKMTKKEDDQGNRRILRNKSVRQMLTWSHYRFRQVLLHQAHKRSCKVLLCQEDYTSKTCGRCGRTYKVGGSRVFECSTCHFKANRDIQAARNICIKHLSVL